MTKYKLVMEITIADTDSPPIDWLPNVIDAVLEDGEKIELIECKEMV